MRLAESVFERICFIVDFAKEMVLVEPVVAWCHAPFGLFEFLGDSADYALFAIKKNLMFGKNLYGY